MDSMRPLRRKLLAGLAAAALPLPVEARIAGQILVAEGDGVAPDFLRSFDQVIESYSPLIDYKFGTAAVNSGQTKIGDAAALSSVFNPFRSLDPTVTRNVENQRYVNFSHSENFAFASDALELTATMPNGVPVNTASTAIAGAVTKSRTVTVVDASAIAVGQVLSLGSAQAKNVCLTRSHGIRGDLTAGNTLTLTVQFPGLSLPDVVFTTAVGVSSTYQNLAQYFVDRVNGDSTLQALGIYAFKDPINPGGYHVAVPQYQNTDTCALGMMANGSVQWVAVSASATGMTHEFRQAHILTYVVAKVGNVLTLNHKITAASGQSIAIMPSRVFTRATTYAAGGASSVLPVGVDVAGVTVGQAMQFGAFDPNLRRVMAVDNVARTITVNGSVSFLDGGLVVSHPIWMAPTVAAVSAGNTLTFAAATFPSSVRVGQQVQIYNTNPNSNLKITAIDRTPSSAVVTLDGPITASLGAQIMFFEPIQSGEIWTKEGFAPGEKGRTWLAIELEADFPDIADLAAWPAFWLYRNPNDLTGLPAPIGGTPEIDMTDTFNYWANSSTATFRPANGGASTELYRHPSHNGSFLLGNNIGKKTRKIQMIWSVDRVYFYIDGQLIWAKSVKYDISARAQISANLAVGNTAVGFNSNGFFPIDMSQFPMKFRLKRMRILAAS